MKTLGQRWFGGREGLLGTLCLAMLLVVVLPLSLDLFRLNLIGKYLTYAFVAVGLVLLWGNAGVLSLGQGVFFGLGGYCMAMFLKLEASDPISTKIQSTPGIPDFMDWNQLKVLPAFWEPFKSFPFTACALLVVPALLACVLGTAMFKRRVGGVYFAVITQAIALILALGIDGNQGYTGGRNGITDLKTLLGWDIRTRSGQYTLYFLTVALLLGVIFVSRWILSSKMGRILNAMSEKEDRVRFSVTMYPTSRSSSSPWPRPLAGWAARCLFCKSVLSPPRWLASCHRLRWSSSQPWAGNVHCWAPFMARCW